MSQIRHPVPGICYTFNYISLLQRGEASLEASMLLHTVYNGSSLLGGGAKCVPFVLTQGEWPGAFS